MTQPTHFYATIPLGNLQPCSYCGLWIPAIQDEWAAACVQCSVACSVGDVEPREGDYGDSVYSAPSCADDRSPRDAREEEGESGGIAGEASPSTLFGGPAEEEQLYKCKQDILYAKLMETFRLNAAPVPCQSELWIRFHRHEALSRCHILNRKTYWRFGLSELQLLMREFAWDLPLGFVVLNLSRKKSFALSPSSRHAEKIKLLPALHYLRMYGVDKVIGFAVVTGKSNSGIALLEVSRSPSFDQKRHRLVKIVADRLLRLCICRWDCGFWHEEMDIDEGQWEDRGKEEEDGPRRKRRER